jgi:hypothetical protein
VLRTQSQAGDRVCIFCGYGMQAGTAEFVTPTPIHPPQEWPPNRRARSCLGCEVVFLLPTGLPADTACPVCMEPVWQETEIAAAYPARVVPFRVDEARAVAALQGAKLNGHSLTQLFGSKRELTRPRPVLLPLWVFSGTGVVHFMPGAVERSFQHGYDSVPVFGTRQLGSQLLTVASDLPLEEAEPCTGAVAADTLVFLLLPDVPLQRAAQEANRRMLRDLRLRALNSQSGAIADSAIADFGVEQVLLPAWIGEVRVGGRGYTGLVNGYTGAVELSSLVRDERR